jgi:hypothetical protein
MADENAAPTTAARRRDPTPTGWIGWILFAGIIMFVGGCFNAIEGLVALFNPGYYLVHATGLVVNVGYGSWGVVLIVFGVLLALAGYGVVMGQTWARVVGVCVAALNAVVNLAFSAAYPMWIAFTVALDLLIIYALAVHGREATIFR